jgi:hypothetical protein
MALMLMMIKMTHNDNGDDDGYGHGDGGTTSLLPQSAPHNFLLPPLKPELAHMKCLVRAYYVMLCDAV